MAFVDPIPGNSSPLDLFASTDLNEMLDNQRGFNDGTAFDWTFNAFTFTAAGGGAMTYTAQTQTGFYVDLGTMLYVVLEIRGTTGGTLDESIILSGFPFAWDTSLTQALACSSIDGSAAGGMCNATATGMTLRKWNGSNFTAGTLRGANVSGFLKKP